MFSTARSPGRFKLLISASLTPDSEYDAMHYSNIRAPYVAQRKPMSPSAPVRSAMCTTTAVFKTIAVLEKNLFRSAM